MTSKNPVSPTSVSQKLSYQTVQKAVESLLKWRSSKCQTQKSELLDQEEFIYLILTLKKIPPKGRTDPFRIPLPHSLRSEFSQFCLFIADRPKSHLTKDAVQKKIQSLNVPISNIIQISKLKSDYRPFEAKRKLCDSYDMFFADSRVIPLLPKLLGKHFFKKKKIPVPLDMKQDNWKEQIEKACDSALLYFGSGTCSVIRVAKTSMGKEEIYDNVISAVNGIAEIVPKKWWNVRSFHLKLLESIALPIYQAVPEIGFKIDGTKEKMDVATGDEREGEKNKKVERKKGKICEVRYLDNNGTDIFDEDELGSDDDDNEYVNGVKDNGSDELRGKKRKKGGEETEGGFGEKGLEKSITLKKSKDGAKQKKAVSPSEDLLFVKGGKTKVK